MSEPKLHEPIPFSAMFLGPKSENEEFLLRLVREVLQDHVYWRRNLFVDDEPAISPHETARLARSDVHAHIVQEVYRLTSRLKREVPLFSPRYLGHMVSDPLLPAVIGTVAALLYNPNNVSAEGSMVTSRLELEVGRQLGRLMGFHETSPDGSYWGHITSGGTVANLEAYATAQALKYHALAVRDAARELGAGAFPMADCLASELELWPALNVSVAETLELSPRLVGFVASQRGHAPRPDTVREVEAAIRRNGLAELGHRGLVDKHASEGGLPRTVLVVPETRHYGWLKIPELFGLGRQAVVTVPVDASFRQSMKDYGQILEELRSRTITPVMCVAVAGTTEESAVDPIGEMVRIRRDHARAGLRYVLHCDAAWGGYARAVFLDREGQFKSAEALHAELGEWPAQPVYEAFRAMAEVDSVTIDPHKMGYVPYPAGAIVYRFGRAKELVGHDAPYVFAGQSDEAPGRAGGTVSTPLGAPSSEAEPLHLGRYIIEGSKPGTAAAAVWLSHHVFPLNELGYGHLIGHTLRASVELGRRLVELSQRLGDRIELLLPTPAPDLNVLCYAFNVRGNRSLAAMNRLNRLLYAELGVRPGAPLRPQPFFVSHTELGVDGSSHDLLRTLLERSTSVDPRTLTPAGQPSTNATDLAGSDDRLFVLRTTLMNPFVTGPSNSGSTLEKFVAALEERLVAAVAQADSAAPPRTLSSATA